MIRELKYYKWVYDNQKITLVDKEKGTSLTLGMKMADSFVRAYISFRVRYNIEQKKELREALKVYRNNSKKQMKELKKQLLLRGSQTGRLATSKEELIKN